MNQKYFLLLFLPFTLFARSPDIPESAAGKPDAPWFTGPLLASSANVVPAGHYNLEPYIYLFDRAATYDNDWHAVSQKSLWNLSFQPNFWIGLTKWADLVVSPQWSWNYREGPAEWTLNDWSAALDLQIYRDKFPSETWIPSIKFSIQETFPTGPYQNLNPKKEFTDQGGQGAWTTAFQLCIGKIFQIKGRQWVQTRLNLNYAVSTPVQVKGINAFGGGTGTKGTVHPGQKFFFDYSIEYSLNRNWVLACDWVGTFQGTSTFSGKHGISATGTPATNGRLPAIQYSIAPAIEYNWSSAFGIVAGAWITLAGKNSSKFYSGVIAVNYYH